MATSSFFWLLRYLRLAALVFLVAGYGLALSLVVRTTAAATEPQVRLSLHTDQPAAFGFWYDLQEGFEDGVHSQTRRRPDWDQLSPLHLAPGRRFDLTPNPNALLLRYQEPSALKRVALLYLGALPGHLSVPGLLFWTYGSWLLLRLLRDVTPETPFTQANAQRLAQLTKLVLGLNLWAYVAQGCVLRLVPAFPAAGVPYSLNHYVQLSSEEVIPGLAVGFMLAVIAAVYRRGVDLSQEADFVI
jgi:hypothetical protein